MKFKLLPLILYVTLTSCADEKVVNISKDSNIRNDTNLSKVYSKSESENHNHTTFTEDGFGDFILNHKVDNIKSLGHDLKLQELSTDCYTDSKKDLELFFVKDILFSIDFFSSDYQTSRGFRVGGTVTEMLQAHPEAIYHESTSNMGDESYYITTKYYETKPNEQGNMFTFHISDSNPNLINIITISNDLIDFSACDI